MPETTHNQHRSTQAERMIRQVGAKQKSQHRADTEKQNFWQSIGLLGVVGWTVALPVLAGIALGVWLDHRFPVHFSWTVMLLAAGLAGGCVMAWDHIQGGRS